MRVGAGGKSSGPGFGTRLRAAVLVLSAGAFSACHPASDGPAANIPVASSGPASGTAVTPAGGDRAPDDGSSAACELASEAKAEALVFDWEKSVARGSFGWVANLVADGNGVLVAGGESSARSQAIPFVASFAADGRERFRVLLDKAVSTTNPPRGAAVALARARSGAVYAVSTAAQAGTHTRVYLTLLDSAGRQRFTTLVDLNGQAAPALLADSDENALVVGVRAPGGGLGVVKYTVDGRVAWSKTFRYEGDVPRVAETGKGYVLAGSFEGVAELGGQTLTSAAKLRYTCGGDQADCEAPARTLAVIELDRDGNAGRVRTFGSPSAFISISGLVALPDGRLTLTGEFFGPKTALGPVSLCEMQPGMPPAEEPRFRETGGAYRCDCRKDQRDLFVLQLGSDATPRWAKTLALGHSEPRVSRSAASDVVVWGFHSGGAASLWERGAGGDVLRRRSAAGSLSVLAAAEDRAVYVSDGRNLKRATLSN